ncbi:MAG: metallophosphoesterase [Bacteroidia bacterium]|nr:metallophosphoesterase [Bacteroidia bacterium]
MAAFMTRITTLFLFAIVLGLLDWYVWQSLKTAVRSWPVARIRLLGGVVILVSVLTLAGITVLRWPLAFQLGATGRALVLMWVFSGIAARMVLMVFGLTDDLRRTLIWITRRVRPAPPVPAPGEPISRSAFLAKTGLLLAATPVAGISWGILSGAHDYRVRRQIIYLPGLPKAFDGMRIVQLSDIHAGSFWNKTAVEGGVTMAMAEKPDLILFTGDLVNDQAVEMRDYTTIFSRLRAPMGVYSVLGNHDYGNYTQWRNPADKLANQQDIRAVHKTMGWELLINEHRLLRTGSDAIALLGVENWAAKGNFPQYGRLSDAWKGTEEAPAKILLSHDPSHWDAEILTRFPDIGLTLSGHTHGMQLGIETPHIKWSPAQYIYDQWAGLYEKNGQQLYVNRGFGYIGYPGRIGIPPEITVIELKAGQA